MIFWKSPENERRGDQILLKSINFLKEHMQRQKMFISFGLFLNPHKPGTPHLSELTFFIYLNYPKRDI